MADSRLPAAFLTPGTSSFADFLAAQAPDLLPVAPRRTPGPRRRPGAARHHDRRGDVPRRRGDGR